MRQMLCRKVTLLRRAKATKAPGSHRIHRGQIHRGQVQVSRIQVDQSWMAPLRHQTSKNSRLRNET